MSNPQNTIVDNAINESILRISTPILYERLDTQEWINLVNDLAARADDWVELTGEDGQRSKDTVNVREYWGTDEDGDDWRIHVHGTA